MFCLCHTALKCVPSFSLVLKPLPVGRWHVPTLLEVTAQQISTEDLQPVSIHTVNRIPMW